MLAETFLKIYNGVMKKHIRGLSLAARQKLLSHHWPGNVRELRNIVERAVILELSEEIQGGSIPDFHLETRLKKTDDPVLSIGQGSLDDLMAGYERQVIQSALEGNRFSLSKTAEQLKLSRHALRYRMQRLNLHGGAESEEDSENSSGREVNHGR